MSVPSTPSSPLPNPLPRVPERVDPEHVVENRSPATIRAELTARERDAAYHLAALQHEVSTVGAGVNVGGRPFFDIVREHPERSLAIASAVGATVGLLLGVRSRRRRRPEPDDGVEFVRARLATLLDETAWKVARGMPTEVAMRDTFKTVPAVYSDRRPISSPEREQTTVGGLILKSALGFGLKTGLDLLTQRLTGHDETFDALADEA